MHSSVKILCPYCYSSELLMYPEGMNSASSAAIQIPAGNLNDNNMELKCSSCGHVFKASEGKLSQDTDQLKAAAYDTPAIQSLNPDELFIYEMCLKQDKFTAIKYCVTTYGWELKEAKDYVDDVMDRVAKNIIKPMPSGNDKYDDEVIRLVQTDGKLSAIKFVRDRTGLSLKDSKDYVEKLCGEMNIPSKKEGCFIATACYGDYNAPEVLVLRNYRDEVLKRTFSGRLFIRVYYSCSPTLADLLSGSPKGKRFIRKFLLKPILHRIDRQC